MIPEGVDIPPALFLTMTIPLIGGCPQAGVSPRMGYPVVNAVLLD